ACAPQGSATAWHSLLWGSSPRCFWTSPFAVSRGLPILTVTAHGLLWACVSRSCIGYDPALGDLQVPVVRLLVADRRHDPDELSGFQDDDDLVGLGPLEAAISTSARSLFTSSPPPVGRAEGHRHRHRRVEQRAGRAP